MASRVVPESEIGKEATFYERTLEVPDTVPNRQQNEAVKVSDGVSWTSVISRIGIGLLFIIAGFMLITGLPSIAAQAARTTHDLMSFYWQMAIGNLVMAIGAAVEYEVLPDYISLIRNFRK